MVNEVEKFAADFREEARARGIAVWEGYPSEAPAVAFPEGATAVDVVDFAKEVGTRLVYLHTEEDVDAGVVLAVAGVAVHGVIHHVVRPEDAVLRVEPNLGDRDGFPGVGLEVTFDDGDPWLSWHEREYQQLSPELRRRVDVIVDDEAYDTWSSGDNVELLDRVAGDLDAQEYARVKEVVRSRWRELHGRRLDAEAERTAVRLVSRDDIDPFLEWGQWERWVEERATDLDPRVRSRAARQLQRLVNEKGLRQQAERELAERAREVLGQLTSLQRDQLGFCTRASQRHELLAPFVEHLEGGRRNWVVRRVARLEETQFARTREARYATAARILIDNHGWTKAATSRTLGISTTVIERLIRENQSWVELDADDPIRSLDDALWMSGR